MTAADITRFWSHVEKTDGCWNWKPTRSHSGKGYGSFKVGGRLRSAHKVSFEIANGPVPPGLNVLHDCDNKICVRPDHLHPGTTKQNAAEAKERGLLKPPFRGIAHCKRGHAFTPENTCVRADGTGRKCRKCGAMYAANRKRAAKVSHIQQAA